MAPVIAMWNPANMATPPQPATGAVTDTVELALPARVIPAGTWISAVNTGKEAIHVVFIFSAPGFDEFMRAESVREGEKVVTLTKAEDAAILAKHAHAVIYKEP